MHYVSENGGIVEESEILLGIGVDETRQVRIIIYEFCESEDCVYKVNALV